MSVVFLAKGTCTLGRTQTDKDGNVVNSTPAQFTTNAAGGSVAVGLLDPETMQPAEPVSAIFGDWDAAGYLAHALELLNPGRRINIPNLKAIVQAAYWEDGNDLLCDYCQSMNCQDCIVKEWKEEITNEYD